VSPTRPAPVGSRRGGNPESFRPLGRTSQLAARPQPATKKAPAGRDRESPPAADENWGLGCPRKCPSQRAVIARRERRLLSPIGASGRAGRQSFCCDARPDRLIRVAVRRSDGHESPTEQRSSSQGTARTTGSCTFPPGLPVTCPSEFSPQQATDWDWVGSPAGATTAQVW
jgi:hypothetical protein